MTELSGGLTGGMDGACMCSWIGFTGFTMLTRKDWRVDWLEFVVAKVEQNAISIILMD